MKKILLTFIAALGLAASANAQLQTGTIFPYIGGASGELTPVNAPFTGMHINLDSISEAGYTIFLDVSATWCHPCWLYHESLALDSIWEMHGPTGAPGVNSSTTNDCYVIFIQGESTSNLAEFYGEIPPATAGSASVETPYATCTQGDWVAGTPFPMVDDTTSADATYGTNAMDATLHIAYFPTVYMICRNKVVNVMEQPTQSVAYAAALASCPNVPPASGSSVGAIATPYTGTDYFICNANPSVSFENYSTTSSITTATVTVTDGSGATVATVPWTGTLAPYTIANVSVPSFAGSTFGGYKYSVNVPGNIYTSLDASPDSEFQVYAASNASAVPFSDNFLSGISYKYNFGTDYSIGITNPAWSGCPNPSGVNENQYMLFDYVDYATYYGGGDFNWIVGNFNTSGYAALSMSFNEAWAPCTSYSDAGLTMSVKVSTDCGSTWTTPWTGTASELTTAAGTTDYGAFVPASASQWQLISFNLPVSDTNDNMMVKFTATPAEDPTNFAFLTNLSITTTALSVTKINKADFISLTPNPAKDMAYVNISVYEPTTVQVQMFDAVGHMVNSVSQDFSAGSQQIALSTDDLASGLYFVKITAGTNTITKQLSVVR